MTEKFYGVGDNAETQTNGAINDTTTSVVVDDASVFTGIDLPFIVTVADPDESNMEMMKVTAVDFGTETLTVERGWKFTAVSHGNASKCALRVIAEHVQDLIDVAVMKIAESCYIEHTKNGLGQVTTSQAWEDATKTTLLADVTYTYNATTDNLPATATRQIYRDDGATVRITETTAFTTSNDAEIVNSTRVVT